MTLAISAVIVIVHAVEEIHQELKALLNREENKMDILRIVLAILLPPLGVFLQVGFGLHFWLNILLTLMGYVPGLVHAIWIIAKK